MKLPKETNEALFLDFCQNFSDMPDFKNWHSAVCLIEVENHLFFIKRSKTMPIHAGQIGFIGGGKKQGEKPIDSALREFKEETGLDFKGEIKGLLPPVMAQGARVIIPIYMKLSMSYEKFLKAIVSNGEWSKAFCIPLSELDDFSSWSFSRFMGARVRKIYFFAVQEYLKSEKNVYLWGATARIVVDFLKIRKAML